MPPLARRRALTSCRPALAFWGPWQETQLRWKMGRICVLKSTLAAGAAGAEAAGDAGSATSSNAARVAPGRNTGHILYPTAGHAWSKMRTFFLASGERGFAARTLRGGAGPSQGPAFDRLPPRNLLGRSLMPRLFVAVDLPEEALLLLDPLLGAFPGARWANREQMHVTLRFLGSVAPDQVAELQQRLAGVATPEAFALSLNGVGVFPPHRRAGRRPACCGPGWPRAIRWRP